MEMTQQQASQVARAMQIAARDELHAVPGAAHSGQPVYAVLNRRATSVAGYAVYHLLTVVGGRIQCDCPAATHARICAHAGAVRAFLLHHAHAGV